jgi:peptidoglycan/LPS O-acetylase OafA/YrhL
MTRNHDSHNLDVLRATAVAFVVMTHLLTFFGIKEFHGLHVSSFGFLGVLMFFVHTSLVLMFSLERQEARYGRHKMARYFLVRRVFRLYPLSIAALSLVIAFSIPAGRFGSHAILHVPTDRLGVAANYLLVQNLADRPSILGPLWSLPYEMQMYLFLPALYLLAVGARSMKALWILWSATVVVALLQGLPLIPDYLMFVPCFIPGIMAYRLARHSRASAPFALFPVLLAVIALVFSYVWQPGDPSVRMGWVACLMLGLALPFFVEVQSARVRRVAAVVCRYSYGVYLTHLLAMYVGFMVLSAYSAPVQWVVFTVLAVAAPVALFHGLERPMIRYGTALANRYFAPPKAAAAPGKPLSPVR